MLFVAACSTPATPTRSEPALTEAPPPPSADRLACDEVAAGVDCPVGTELATKFGRLYPNGSFCEVTCLRDGTPHGPFVLEHINSDGYAQHGQFVDGEESGTWTSFQQNPETLERKRAVEKRYREGVLTGPYKRWGWDGQLMEEGVYAAGEKDGAWVRYAPGGEWTFKGSFHHGVPIGPHVERYSSGKLRSERSYDEVGRPDGRWCFWKSDGTEIECYEIERGTGTLREYSATGELVRRSDIVDGKRHGITVERSHDGTQYEAQYVEGEQDGPERLLEGECVARQVMWAGGVEDGPMVEQNCGADPPIVTTEGSYCTGHRCGKWTIRSDAGQLLEVIEYSKTGDIRARIVYDDQGEIEELDEAE